MDHFYLVLDERNIIMARYHVSEHKMQDMLQTVLKDATGTVIVSQQIYNVFKAGMRWG